MNISFLFFLTTASLCHVLHAQNNHRFLIDSFPKYEGVVTIDSIPKDELYRKIREWVSLNYNSSNDVIQYEDANDASLIVKGTHKYIVGSYDPNIEISTTCAVDHTLQVECREGRFKVSLELVKMESHIPGIGSNPIPMISITHPEIYRETIRKEYGDKIYNKAYQNLDYDPFIEASNIGKSENKKFYLGLIISITEHITKKEEDW
jgi:hypothetical protein